MEAVRKKILVTGLVQGIGFRPFVAEQAEKLGLAGQVKNLGGIVEISIQGSKEAVDKFIYGLESLSERAVLPGARVDSLVVEDMMVECLENVQIHGDRDIKKNIEGSIEGKDVWDKFQIVESNFGREARRFLPVDLPICDRCVAEMHDKNNRRYRYPFISCVSCGPRFSIQKKVPYDRDTITMDTFPMCEDCYKEYTEKGNIRRHAQTIACEKCGPKLKYISLFSANVEKKEEIQSRKPNGSSEINRIEISDTEAAIQAAITALKAGKIGAIKDIGGYHFAFSPYNAEAAKRLREFKNRDKKPFAVMFLNVEAVKEYCEVSKIEEGLLLSSARPIVLLKKKKDFVPEICGESDRIGALLPCNPLQILLLEETGPLVMTSGNRGGEPIIISEEEMLPHLENGIDFMLTHDREILTPLDDSIYQVNSYVDSCVKKTYENMASDGEESWASESGIIQLIRRARGLAPEPIHLSRKLKRDCFAAGGDLKASFALGRNELVYMSQYFGDLEDVRCGEARKKGLVRMKDLLEIEPEIMAYDMHPSYVSAIEAKSGNNIVHKQMENDLSGDMVTEESVGLEMLPVQHHHAHVASVIGEHGLTGKVLGIACDGTGFGTDGSIWGSEFLLCENADMKRIGHFSKVKLLGGDASAKQTDMTLFSYILSGMEAGKISGKAYHEIVFDLRRNTELTEDEQCMTKEGEVVDRRDAGADDAEIDPSFTLQALAWKNNINTAYSTSMGRLFDAVAALLDICHENSYEGECAIKLEQYAHKSILPRNFTDPKSHESAMKNENGHIDEERGRFHEILHMDIAKIDGVWVADSVKLLVDMQELKTKYSKEDMAYLFHHAVAEAVVQMADEICKEEQLSQVALSGGSFINRILLAEVMDGLSERQIKVYTNEKLPCGDGCIALGQMYLATFQED